MVKVFSDTNNSYYMDGYLVSNLDTAKKVAAKDWDMFFIYDGLEGTGKSVKAMQDAYYCDNTLTIDRVAFTPEEFKACIKKATRLQAVIYDEAMTGLSSRGAMSRINKAIVSMIAEIRQKNLFVFIVLPTFFELDKYVALWRSRALIHVYSGEGFARGYFAFYNVDRKKDLYINGKKYYSYLKPKPNFIGRFTNHYPLSEDEYREKKLKSLSEKEETPNYLEQKYKTRLCAALRLLNEHYTQEEISRRLVGVGCDLSSVRVNQLIRDETGLYLPKT